MQTIVNGVRIFWHKYAAILIAPVLAAVVSLSYFIVKSDDFLTVQSAEIKNNGHLPEIVDGQKYVQEIHGGRNGLSKISLLLATFGRVNNSNIYISLFDNKGNLIQGWEIKSSLLRDNSYRTVSLDRIIENSKGEVYYLTITTDAVAKQGITVRTRNVSQKSGLSLNGKNVDKTLCYRLTYRLSYAELLSKAKGFHITALLVLAYLVLTLLPRLSNLRIENAFLICWVFLSLMYSFSATLFQVPDEASHFFRSYEVSYGYLISNVNEHNGHGGRELPLDVNLNQLKNNWQSFSDNSSMKISEKLVFKDFNNIAVYSPVTYAVQATGIFIARHLTENVAVIAYSGRLSSWLFITLILYVAIRIIPIGKEVIALIVLLPMNIHESVSLASDGQVVAVSILLVAIVISLRYSQSFMLKPWQYCALFLPAVMISQLKLVYLPFILVYVLIPDVCFGGRKRKWVYLAFIAFVAVASNLIWLKMCDRFLVKNGSDFDGNLGYIINEPLYYLITLARTFFTYTSGTLEQMVGSRLAWLNVLTTGVLVQLYLCILGYKFLVNRKKLAGKELFASGVFAFVIVSIVLLIATSEYLYWTPPYERIVNGVQGRYLIPLLLPLYFVINDTSGSLKNCNKTDNLSISILSFIVCINFCACVALLFHCINL